MGRISKTDDNVVAIPSNVSVSRDGYVYLNTQTWWGETKGGKKGAQYKKVCVGLALAGKAGWRDDRRMWANDNYRSLFPEAPTEEAPWISDCVSVGLTVALSAIAEECGILECLEDGIKDIADVDIVIDLACHVIAKDCTIARCYPQWARKHYTRSAIEWSEENLSCVLKGGVDDSKVDEFKRLWAKRVIGDGRVLLCYASTDNESPAEGVFLVPANQAMGIQDPDQMNTDYVVRQKDGLPVTFTECPGSVDYVMWSSDASDFFGQLLGEDGITDLTMVFDRGSVLEEDVRDYHSSGIGFLMLLDRDTEVADEVVTLALDSLRSVINYLVDKGVYAVTLSHELFEGIDAWFHVVLDPQLEKYQHHELSLKLSREEEQLTRDMARQRHYTEAELDCLRAHFSIEAHEEGTLVVDAYGMDSGETVPAYVIDSIERDMDKIDAEWKRCGVYVLATDRESSALSAMEMYARCKMTGGTLACLKGNTWMEDYDIGSNKTENLGTLVWFVSSVLRTLLVTKTKELCNRDEAPLTMPRIIYALDEIEAIYDPKTGRYQRRHPLNQVQKDILSALGVKESQLDEAVKELTHE